MFFVSFATFVSGLSSVDIFFRYNTLPPYFVLTCNLVSSAQHSSIVIYELFCFILLATAIVIVVVINVKCNEYTSCQMEFTFGGGIWSATGKSECRERKRERDKFVFAMYQI